MSARILALAITLVAAGASAQEFRIERDLDLVRRTADNRPLQNIYWVSLPLRPQIADAANTFAPMTNRCVGDDDGPQSGDGIINSDDLICSWWTARANPATAGGFMLSQVDTARCTIIHRYATVALGRIRFAGRAFEIQEQAGFQVVISVRQGDTYSPRNRAVLVGDDDPSWAGHEVRASPTCPAGTTGECCLANAPRRDLIALPYDVMYSNSDEILCGLEGVDWTDINGRPDRCWDDRDGDGRWDAGEAMTGVFDGRVVMIVSKFANDEAINAPVFRMATIQLGALLFHGTRFDLVQGDAYLLNISKQHSPTLWFPPRN